MRLFDVSSWPALAAGLLHVSAGLLWLLLGLSIAFVRVLLSPAGAVAALVVWGATS